MANNTINAVIAALIATLFWSSAFVGIRVGLEEFSPMTLALLRFLVASIFLFIYIKVRKIKLFLDYKDIPIHLLCGLSGVFFYNVALNNGEMTVTGPTASMIISFMPVTTAIISYIFLKEKITLIGWIGVIIGFSGIFLITLASKEGINFDYGAFLILISALSASIYTTLQKYLVKKYGAVRSVTYAIWFGTIPFLFWSNELVVKLSQVSTSAIYTGIYLGIFPAAIAYILWSTSLKTLSATKTATFLYLNPVFTIIISYFWIKELPNVTDILGGFIVLSGVVITHSYGKKRKRKLQLPT